MKKAKKQTHYGIDKRSIMAKEFDYFLFIITIALAIFGVIVIFSATRSMQTNTNVIVQTIGLILGTGVCLFISFFDYEQFKNLIKPVYIFSVIILLFVLFFGVTGDWGARSWIRFGSIGLQPAEIAKLCFIITFSYHLEKVGDKINKIPVILGLMLHIGVPVALILMQPDMGSTMVFVFMFLCMIFVAKLSYKYIIPVGIAGVFSLPFIYKYVLSEYQRNRIQVFLNPEMDPLNKGYNVIQSKIAVGSGQIFGKGYLEGTQNQMGYLPTKSTDFIYSVISEEFGFIGAMIIVLVLFAIILRCFKAAQRADNAFGAYICTGVGAMFLFHTFENVGMCIGLTPVTGIPLPFLSYGGTSLITNLAAIGLVLSVEYHNKPRTSIDLY